MDINFKSVDIKDISLEQLEKLNIKCVSCNYWFDAENTNFIEELCKNRDVWNLLKSKIFEKRNKNSYRKIFCFKQSGGRIKGAFSGKECIGIILSGKYYLFPKLKSFKVYPPGSEGMFLGCLYVVPEYRDMGVEKRILMALEKDLINEGIKFIETVGERLSDDTSKDEYRKSHLIPVKFLIKNGFYIIKNDRYFPLLRLDLKTVVADFAESKLLSVRNISLKKKVRSPAMIKKN